MTKRDIHSTNQWTTQGTEKRQDLPANTTQQHNPRNLTTSNEREEQQTQLKKFLFQHLQFKQIKNLTTAKKHSALFI